tara:strand:- start:929 stop:1444 length:516 start_codon:yes stop_codon:yes gene_type:complete
MLSKIVQMGQTPTRQVGILKCPDGYDTKKFQKICNLFDKVDKDSNLGVSSDEIEDIAAHHVKNCISRMQNRIKSKNLEFQVSKTQIVIDKKNEIDSINEKYNARTQKEERIYNADLKNIETKVEWYQSLDKNDQAEAFMKAIMPSDGKHIDFWSFFDYMKTRVGDIKNIEE